MHLPARPGSSGGRSVRSCGRRRTAAALKSHLVEVACELAALDPPRGSKPRQQLEDATCIKGEAVPDTRSTKFLLFGQKDLRSRLLHVPTSGADSYTYRTRRVPKELLLPAWGISKALESQEWLSERSTSTLGKSLR